MRAGKAPSHVAAIGVHPFAYHPELRFEIARHGLETVGIDCERSAKNHERRAVFGGADCLFDGEASDGLDRNANRLDDFAQLIERA